MPDRLRVAFSRKERREEPIWVEVPVVDEHDEPLWSEHPVHGHKIDIAAIPIPSSPDASEVWVTPINAPPQVVLKQRIGMPLFIPMTSRTRSWAASGRPASSRMS